MTLFIIAGAILTGVALIMLIPPLFRDFSPSKDKELLKKAKREIQAASTEEEKAALSADFLKTIEQQPENNTRESNPLAALLVAFFIPIVAIGIYLKLGSPELVTKTGAVANTAQPQTEETPNIGELIAKLEESLVDNPDNAEGWYLLARTLMSTQEFDKAAKAMGKVIELTDEADPNLLVQYADSLSMAAQGNLLGEPLSYVEKALSINPDHPEALWLRGIGYTQEDRLAEAVMTWKKAVRSLADRPEAQAELRQMIADTEVKLAKGSAPSEASTTAPSSTASSIKVTVSLSPELAEKAKPDAAVFIFARAAAGPPMPVAAQKLSVADLPATVTLDDSQAMMPNLTLSSLDEAVIGARISLSGEPTAQPGDLEAEPRQISVSETSELSLIINQLR